MNYKEVSFSDGAKSFHVEYVAEDSEGSSGRRPRRCNEDVRRMVERSGRARLISQVVGAAEDPHTKDFTSSFQCATRDTDPPQFATSHKVASEPRSRSTIPTYPSLVQSLRWNPYVEMSSAENSKTNLTEEKKFNCRCETCTMRNCPSRFSSATILKQSVYKDNIMTFSDRYTMTPKLNDACCGVCTPIPSSPKTSDVCVPPEVAVRDTETVTHYPMFYQQCAPIPILKKPDHGQSCQATYGYCGHATGHVPVGIRQEAVRDTDIGEDYCEPIKQKSVKGFFKSKKRPCLNSPPCVPEYGIRKTIYNEGICDVGSNCRLPMRVPSPLNIRRERSRDSVRSKNRCYIDNDVIPYAHRTESRYHHSCKRPVTNPIYRTDVDDVKHVVESPKLVRKSLTSRLVRQQPRGPSVQLPKKVLTSEANIDSYIECGRQNCRKKNKK